jgi:hypothetical protein
MLPAPARIAAAPTASSRPSWNPAVPPPPVTGAPLGIWVDDWVGVGVVVTVWVTVTVGVGVEVAGVLSPEVPGEVLVLVVMPGVLTWAVLPGVEVLPAVAAPVPVLVEALVDVPAMKEDTDGDGDPDPEHAERAAMPSMVRAPKPAAVTLALSAVLPTAVRTFIEPPHAPFSPTPAAETGTAKKTPGRPGSLPASAEGSRRRP